MGQFGRGQRKYEKDKVVPVVVEAAIPQGEFDILVCYSRGLTMRQIAIETGSDISTVTDIIRRNLSVMVNAKSL